ncbi:hypothetical protein CDAR_480931 [Caerostris darwini]|uniref:Uncharacterized protein n=1 Tax=Caerostris darwini TaxID=1538125 RepID=A0AAV4W3P1_9ARAC|nr:hypothetical protein CDAR_480931 [Caerostris darwini]
MEEQRKKKKLALHHKEGQRRNTILGFMHFKTYLTETVLASNNKGPQKELVAVPLSVKEASLPPLGHPRTSVRGKRFQLEWFRVTGVGSNAGISSEETEPCFVSCNERSGVNNCLLLAIDYF